MLNYFFKYQKSINLLAISGCGVVGSVLAWGARGRWFESSHPDLKKIYLYLIFIGDVAQLARVLDWQSRGRGFEPHLLHKPETPLLAGFYRF